MNFIDNIGSALYENVLDKGRWMFYLEGIGNTLLMTVGAVLIGILLGTIISLIKVQNQLTGRMKGASWLRKIYIAIIRVANWLCNIYTTIIRGTPVLVQLLIIYYMIFTWAPKSAAPFVAALAFGLNSGAYVSETIRAGINSVDKGQTEAGRSLGMSQGKTMRLIILPQAIKNILPALFNEMIMLLKETSVAGWIAVTDITRAGDVVRSQTWSFTPLLVSAAIYLVLVIGLTKVQQVIERRMAVSDRG